MGDPLGPGGETTNGFGGVGIDRDGFGVQVASTRTAISRTDSITHHHRTRVTAMSMLRAHATKTVTTTSGTETMLVRVTAAANHKVKCACVHNQSSTPRLRFACCGRPLAASLDTELLAKIDSGDSETIQTSCRVSPPTAPGGSPVVLDGGWITGSGSREFRVVILNSGETLTVAALEHQRFRERQTEVDIDE